MPRGKGSGFTRERADLRTLHGRLQAARASARYAYSYMARRMGLARITVRFKFTGMRSITTDEITLIGVICHVPPAWLMNGQGEIPGRVRRMLRSMRWVDLDGKEYAPQYLTELQLVMGPYLSKAARARDRTDMTTYWKPVDMWH